MWSAFMVGGAAVAFTAVSAVPAGAAEGGVSFSNVKVNGGKPIVIGVKEEVVVHATYRMTTKLRYDPGVVVFPYRGGLESGDQLWHAIDSSDCKVVNRAKGICDFEEWLYIDPRHPDFGNKDAGAWKTAGRVWLAGDRHDIDDVKVPLQIKRATRATVNASPEPVRKGSTLTVTGKVTRANWDTHTYQGYAGRTVSLQFKAAGAKAYTTVRKVKSNRTGVLRTTVKAARSGTWRWVYYGNTTSGATASTGDYVVVR
ncbi:hypothetical protein ACFYMR_04475 [Streptomyces albogriseolus]|uniref:hypothetical protein n=1 Tax=Streptomyces albogriseolus TaxID=1887 RepID=UPI0036C120B7